MTAIRTIGVTVMPEHFQVEGVEAVLDNLQRRACVTAIATSPHVMAPMPDGGIISVFTDVSALHRAEHAARERGGRGGHAC